MWRRTSVWVHQGSQDARPRNLLSSRICPCTRWQRWMESRTAGKSTKEEWARVFWILIECTLNPILQKQTLQGQKWSIEIGRNSRSVSRSVKSHLPQSTHRSWCKNSGSDTEWKSRIVRPQKCAYKVSAPRRCRTWYSFRELCQADCVAFEFLKRVDYQYRSLLTSL